MDMILRTKRIWLRGAGLALTATALLTGARAQVQVTVDQKTVGFEGPAPVERGGRVLVPLRGVLERVGAYVAYDNNTKTVTALRGATNITLSVGSHRALVGDRTVTLDTPAMIVDGTVMVPLRFVGEALGARVSWNDATRTVTIDTDHVASAAARPAHITTGTVVAVYPNLAPRRIVVRVLDRQEDQTIPLAEAVRLPVPLDRIHVGDKVEIQQTADGEASAIAVLSRVRTPVPATTRPSVATHRSPVFKGEFLEANRVASGNYVLKMTDGRLIEVPAAVLALYGSDKIGVNDLRSGDQLTVAVDPATRLGTRIVVAVEK